MAVAVGGAAIFLYHDRGSTSFEAKYGTFRATPADASSAKGKGEDAASAAGVAQARIPLNVRPRLVDWALYSRGIVESPWTLFLGHPRPFDRTVSTSAHNYYLDLLYNFGLIAVLPLFWLIAYTGVLLWRARRRLQRDLPLLGLAVAVFFLVAIDNNFKVTLRQPYPGIFAFFLWGVLMSRLAASPRVAYT